MTTQQVTNIAKLIDQQLDALFHAAGSTGVDPSDLYAIQKEDPSISRDMIYDALMRAKSRLDLERFAPDITHYGKIWYRLRQSTT